MPVLKNQRWERYAQELAKGKTGEEAHAAAGYSKNRGNASTLRSRQIILNRVAELQSKIAENVVEHVSLTRADLLHELSKIAKAPVNIEDVRPTDKRAACMDYAKIDGLIVEKVEHTVSEIDGFGLDELRELIASEIASFGQDDEAFEVPGGSRTPREQLN